MEEECEWIFRKHLRQATDHLKNVIIMKLIFKPTRSISNVALSSTVNSKVQRTRRPL
jgi:hypothetical protein